MGRQLIDKQALKNVLYGVEKVTCDFSNHKNQRVRLPEGIDVVLMTVMKSLNFHDLHLLVEKPISRWNRRRNVVAPVWVVMRGRCRF